MSRKLTKKQKTFVKEYLKTGNGAKSALKSYNTTDNLTARTIASENLTKPNIIKSIQEAIPDELLTERHIEILNKRDNNGNLDNIVLSGVQLGYRLKGYLIDKSLNVNVDYSPTEEERKQANEALQTLVKK